MEIRLRHAQKRGYCWLYSCISKGLRLHLLSTSRGNCEQIISVISLHSSFLRQPSITLCTWQHILALTLGMAVSSPGRNCDSHWGNPLNARNNLLEHSPLHFNRSAFGAWGWWLRSDISCKEIQISVLVSLLGFCLCVVLAKTELGFQVDCSFIPVDPLNEIKRDDRANTSCPQWDHSRFLEHCVKDRWWWPE